MKHFRGEKQRKPSMFYRLLAPYLAILLVTLVVGVAMFYSVGKRYSGETQSLRQEQVNQLAVAADYYLQYAVNMGDTIRASDKLTPLMMSNPSDYAWEELRRELQRIDTQEYMAGFLVYLNRQDSFLTTGVVREAETYYNWYEGLEGVPYGDFEAAYLQPYHMRSFMPPQTLVKKAGYSVPVLPYVQSAPLRNARVEPEAQIILLLDARHLHRRLQQFADDYGGHAYLVYDEEGTVAAQTQAAPAFAQWQMDGADNGTSLNGEDYLRFSSPLESGAGQVVVFSPAKGVLSGWNTMLRMASFMVAGFVLVGILAAVMLARMNYKPIREINALVGAADGGGGNEYERIKHAVMTSITDKQALSSVIEQQMPMVKESLLLRLLNSPPLPGKEPVGGLEALGIGAEGRVFYVLACEFDIQTEFFSQEERLPDENLRSARIILENVGLEVFSRDFEAHYVNTGRTSAAFVLSHPVDAPPKEDAARVIGGSCRFIQSFARLECGLVTLVGVSTGRAGLQGLPRLQDEARHALEHAMMLQEDGFFCYADLKPEQTQEHFFYPPDVDAELAGLLRNGSFDEARMLIDRLYTENFVDRSISLHAGRCFVYEVGTTVDRVLMNLQAEDSREQEPLGELLRKLGGRISFDKARDTTLDYVEKCRTLAGYRRLGQTEQLVERIGRYIDENVAEKWLDLNSLAEEFKVTPQYISHIFKKYKKENVKDYISRRRLAEAKRYLRETELTGEAISLRIGYASEAGLIRLFKKYEVMTPNTYRQAHRKAN